MNELISLLFCLLVFSFANAGPLEESASELEQALKNTGLTFKELLSSTKFVGGVVKDSVNQVGSLISDLPGQILDIPTDLSHREPDFYFNPQQMAEYRGFKFEKHHVVTEDCYILEMHRIINPFDKRPNKRPVLLQHGVNEGSTCWMINSIGGNVNDTDDRNLAFALAKRGFDVWLGNTRGNTYSKNHTTFSADDPEFWKFNFDNHAFQDMPAQIAHVQAVTNYDQIAYVGHSQGTLVMFQLLAMKPEVAKAIRVYVALAPVAYLEGVTTPLRVLAASKVVLKALLYTNIELTSETPFNRILADTACRTLPGLLCKNTVDIIMGFSEGQLNSSVIVANYPKGTSAPNLVHYGLNVRSPKFEFLDYMDSDTNMLCYNQTTPPIVPLEKITLEDIHLFNSENDALADPEDVERLKNALKVKFESKKVEVKEFSHADFLYSQHVDTLVYRFVFDILEKKKPMKSVPPAKRLRLKRFDENTCEVPNPDTLCHLDLQRALKNIA